MPSIEEATSITRADLLRFPKPTADIILSLQKNGWRVSINKNTHARLLAPDGVTIVGATTNKNSHVYLQQQVLKYNAGEPIEEPVKATTSEKVRCPRPDCGKWFSDLDHLNIHINVDHENMAKCPDCDYTHRLSRIVMIHRSKSHGYESPSKARRKELARLRTQVAGDEAAFENRTGEETQDELSQVQIMDEAAIISIEPHKLSYADELPAPVYTLSTTFIEATGHEPIIKDEREWESIHLDDLGNMTIDTLLYVYQAAGLDLRLQVRKTSWSTSTPQHETS